MVSYAGVFEHPFHTTSNNGGKYELRLPPGKYEIVAWHEKFGEKVATLDVSENAALELNFKFDAQPRNDNLSRAQGSSETLWHYGDRIMKSMPRNLMKQRDRAWSDRLAE